MSSQTQSNMANFIWSICNLLRGPYKRNEYRKVILPLTVLRRFDCILAPTKQAVLDEYHKIKDKSENIIEAKLTALTGVPFFNLSKFSFANITHDPNQIAPNLTNYINGFSKNVRTIFQRFDFGVQVSKMNEKNLLFEVVKKFASDDLDLSPEKFDNIQMGYIFEELIRIGSEQSNEEAGEHFTPREVIKLMVNLLLSPEKDLGKSFVVKTIYDPACGTGGMLSVAENYLRELNADSQPHLYGQDVNDEAWAVCCSDMLIKNEDAEQIKLGDSFTNDGFPSHQFDYMLANPPFGVEWKQQQKFIEDENQKLGYDGRFGPGLPRINDGSLLFLMHMISKMQSVEKGGSRIGIVFNGSPLFTGDAGSGESNIRKWIIESDWLEAIIALPDQLFYNTGISTYIWVLTNRKEEHRKGKVQLIDAREFYIKMRKSLGNKRNKIADDEDNGVDQIAEITRIYGRFADNDTVKLEKDGVTKEIVVSKLFSNAAFGYNKITVERPMRMNFQAHPDRMKRLEDIPAFRKLAKSEKKNDTARMEQIEEGKKRQDEIKDFAFRLSVSTGQQLFKDRELFLKEVRALDKELGIHLAAAEVKLLLEALGEKDETACICVDSKGNSEPDPDLRDTENVPLIEEIDQYFKREVLPHVPDAWIDYTKTKTGYEIPLNRHFYQYVPPRPLEEIESDIESLESEIVELLSQVTRSRDLERDARGSR